MRESHNRIPRNLVICLSEQKTFVLRRDGGAPAYVIATGTCGSHPHLRQRTITADMRSLAVSDGHDGRKCVQLRSIQRSPCRCTRRCNQVSICRQRTIREVNSSSNPSRCGGGRVWGRRSASEKYEQPRMARVHRSPLHTWTTRATRGQKITVTFSSLCGEILCGRL